MAQMTHPCKKHQGRAGDTRATSLQGTVGAWGRGMAKQDQREVSSSRSRGVRTSTTPSQTQTGNFPMCSPTSALCAGSSAKDPSSHFYSISTLSHCFPPPQLLQATTYRLFQILHSNVMGKTEKMSLGMVSLPPLFVWFSGTISSQTFVNSAWSYIPSFSSTH